MRNDAAQNGEGYKVMPIPAAAFSVNAQDATWVDAMRVKQPLATLEQKLKVSGRRVPRRVHARRRVPAIRCALQGRSRLAIRQLRCGHDVMIDQPEETCRCAHSCRLGKRVQCLLAA
jgi:hypothetical protein